MESLTNDQFVANVRQWAEDRNLIEGSTPDRQFLKLVEEVGELVGAAEIADRDSMIDAIGDVDVVLVIVQQQISSSNIVPWFGGDDLPCSAGVALGMIAKSLGRGDLGGVSHFASKMRAALESLARDGGLEIGECRAQAWSEIKDRKGRVENGVFVKEAA